MAPKKKAKAKDMSDEEDNAQDQGGFDPNMDLSALPEKKRKKIEKTLYTWRAFVDFIFRHIAIVTYKYNCFEKEDLQAFLISLQKAEKLRSSIKLKKGEEPRISCYRVMKEAADQLAEQRHFDDANRIRRFLDIAGRMKGLSMIAGGFVRALKKGKARNLENIKYYMDYWKGFTARTFDFTGLSYRNADPNTFSELGQKFMPWPTVVRTALFLSQRFLQLSCESTGLTLLSTDPKVLKKHTQAAEFIVASKIEESLSRKVEAETKNFLIGNPLLSGSKSSGYGSHQWELPEIIDLDPDMIKPIPSNGMLLDLPAEPPKEGKGKKKGRKGSGKKGSAGGKKKTKK